MRKWPLLVSCVGAFVGCASDEEKTGTTPAAGTTWAQAEYTLTANAVDDQCVDGAAELVAIPNGDTRDFTNPLAFPGSADTTFTTKLKLVAPFTETDVTFKKTADNTWEWSPKSTNTGVDLGALKAEWAGCNADFEFSGTWKAETTADKKVRFTGSAGFGITKVTGSGCPVLQATPCAVTLTMIAAPK